MKRNPEGSRTSQKKYSKNGNDPEALWSRVFWDEYKPDTAINFQIIKNHLLKVLEKYGRLRDYSSSNLVPKPIALCDMFIASPINASINSLENISEPTKEAIADLLLWTVDLQAIKNSLGEAILYWIWYYANSYSKKCNEDIAAVWMQTWAFVWSEEQSGQLEKARLFQWQIHWKDFNIHTTLLTYDICKGMPSFLASTPVKNYLNNALGKDFSLQTLEARNASTYGKEKERFGKDVDTNGKELKRELTRSVWTYDKTGPDNKYRYTKIVNRGSDAIYKDRSWSMYTVYLDGPVGIGLFYKGLPVAVLSLSARDHKTLYIHQMQTIKAQCYDRYGREIGEKTNPITQTIPWQDTLYTIANMLCEKYSISWMIIQSWKNNKRIREPRKELQFDDIKRELVEVSTDQKHLSLAIAEHIYDNFARKKGFELDEKTRNWYREIQ